MNLRILSYLASLGFRADLDPPQESADVAPATQDSAVAVDCDEASNLNFVLAL